MIITFHKVDLQKAREMTGSDLITAAYATEGFTCWITKFRSKWTARKADGTFIAEAHSLKQCKIYVRRTLGTNVLLDVIRENLKAGLSPYEGLASHEIGRANRALMMGINDEAFPSQEEWSTIVD